MSKYFENDRERCWFIRHVAGAIMDNPTVSVIDAGVFVMSGDGITRNLYRLHGNPPHIIAERIGGMMPSSGYVSGAAPGRRWSRKRAADRRAANVRRCLWRAAHWFLRDDDRFPWKLLAIRPELRYVASDAVLEAGGPVELAEALRETRDDLD